MCHEKQRLFNRAKRSKRKQHWEAYRSHKKATLKALRRGRWGYIDNILQLGLEEGSSRPFWRYVKAQKQDSAGVTALKDQGKLFPDSSTKAEILNRQFKSVFTKDNEDHRNSGNCLHGPHYPSINRLSISVEGVEKFLSQIQPSKAAGPDAIPCRLLKELATELTPVLTLVFRQSLESGTLPSIWTTAFVTPVFKKGNRNEAENYRPVSLMCVTCKIFEHVICKHILNHLDRYQILTPLNHDFRTGHSCESQLLVTNHDLMRYRDRKVQVDLAILDFSKAFDTVPHNRLLQKLEFYYIQGDVLKWTSVFLKSRYQCVVVEGQRSGTFSVDSGVPQGTVLGPLLLLLHINDLPSVVSSQVRLFADDCLMYCPIEVRGDQEDFQSDLDALQQWGNAWGMRFNAKKCHIMRISRSTRPLSKFYYLCNTILSEVNCAKYLGINITNDLQWSNHISGNSSKANSSLGFIQRNLRSCPQKLKEVACISMVSSVMEYSAIIWNLTSERTSTC